MQTKCRQEASHVIMLPIPRKEITKNELVLCTVILEHYLRNRTGSRIVMVQWQCSLFNEADRPLAAGHSACPMFVSNRLPQYQSSDQVTLLTNSSTCTLIL